MASGNSGHAWGPESIQPTTTALVVGRGSSATVALWHPTVSRLHAELRFLQGQILLRDLGSRSGTRVNGDRLGSQEVVLREGDRLEFGAVTYEVHQGLLLLAQPTEGLRLDLRGLVVERGGKRLLDGVSFTVLPGQFVGVLGPSGSGKSTLLKCLAGYLPIAAGSVRLDGWMEGWSHSSRRNQAAFWVVVEEEGTVVASGTKGRWRR